MNNSSVSDKGLVKLLCVHGRFTKKIKAHLSTDKCAFVLFISRSFLQASCLTIAHIFNKNWLITLYTDHQDYKDNIIVEAIGMQEGKKLWKLKEGTGSLEHPSVIFPFLGVVMEMLIKPRCLSCFVFSSLSFAFWWLIGKVYSICEAPSLNKVKYFYVEF